MVDLESDVLVSKVVIKNRQNCCKDRLSSTTVSLLDSEDNVVGTYRIGDASQLGEIEMDSSEFALPSSPSSRPRRQHPMKPNIGEVEVHNQSNSNRVKNKATTQSRDLGTYTAADAGNNDLVADFLITSELILQAGDLLELTVNGALGMAHKHTCESEDRTGDFVKAMLEHGFNANGIAADLAIPCSAEFQIFAELEIDITLRLSKILDFLPDLADVVLTQKALIDYSQNGWVNLFFCVILYTNISDSFFFVEAEATK